MPWNSNLWSVFSSYFGVEVELVLEAAAAAALHAHAQVQLAAGFDWPRPAVGDVPLDLVGGLLGDGERAAAAGGGVLDAQVLGGFVVSATAVDMSIPFVWVRVEWSPVLVEAANYTADRLAASSAGSAASCFSWYS